MTEMAAVSKEALLSHLQGLGVTIQLYEHPVVMTVEEQALHIGHLDAALSKNLFLKDKKGRLYLVSALATTNVELKALSQRLGLGKGGLRMAPEDALQEVLKVPLGSVTPLALINPSARSVILLLDHQFKNHSRLFFHPLINNSTLAMTSAELDTFLKSIDIEPSYVDFEAAVAVGKDQPPDLAMFVTATTDQSGKPTRPGAEESANAVHNSSSLKPLPVSKPKQVTVKKVSEGGSLKKLVGDPQSLLNYILDETITTAMAKVKAEIGDQISKDLVSSVSSKVREQIAPDLENIIMLFKNTAYTQGFVAGRTS